jgi:hypothetical protein
MRTGVSVRSEREVSPLLKLRRTKREMKKNEELTQRKSGEGTESH